MKARLQEKFNLLNIDELNVLNNIASDKNKEICNNFIDIWRNDGLLFGYFGTKCNNIYKRRRVTNNEILELYIYYCYIMYELDVHEAEQEAFRHLTDYYYKEGQKEVGAEPKDIPNAVYLALLGTPCVNGYTLEAYKGAKALQSTYQTHRRATMEVQQGKAPNVNDMEQEIQKQQKERLKIGLKISGVIDMILIGMNNKAKIEGMKRGAKAVGIPENDLKARFVAVMDDRTTKMCKSLNGQVFSVYGENTFTRYSAEDDAMRTYTCKGLVEGLNLPPISNHFHWCRSTIIYNIDYPKEAWYDKYVEMKTKNIKES